MGPQATPGFPCGSPVLAPPQPRVATGPSVASGRVLEAAGRIASRTDEHEVLDRIASWLRDDPHPVLVPVEERSLELFDDEKALDRYLMTRLFTSGALTLDLLACYAPPPPFASQHVPGTGPTRLLVVENLATYTSFLTALRLLAPRSRPDLHVGWGVGAAFEQSVLSIPLLEPTPASAYYFGDLDQAGLRIASNATAKAVAAGLPGNAAAGGPVPVPPRRTVALASPGRQQPRHPTRPGRGIELASVHAALPGQPALRARQRIPQERLGLEALHREPTLLTALYPPD